MLKSKFTNESFKKEYLVPLESAVERYTEIDNIINGKTELKTFKEQKLNENRHLIFHYPRDRKDYSMINEVLSNLEKDGQKFKYCESDNTDVSESQKFEFAAAIQLNALFGIHKANGDEFTRIVTDLAFLTAKIINLLEILFGEFVSKKQWNIESQKNDDGNTQILSL